MKNLGQIKQLSRDYVKPSERLDFSQYRKLSNTILYADLQAYMGRLQDLAQNLHKSMKMVSTNCF